MKGKRRWKEGTLGIRKVLHLLADDTCVRHTVHCTLYTVHCTLYTAHHIGSAPCNSHRHTDCTAPSPQ